MSTRKRAMQRKWKRGQRHDICVDYEHHLGYKLRRYDRHQDNDYAIYVPGGSGEFVPQFGMADPTYPDCDDGRYWGKALPLQKAKRIAEHLIEQYEVLRCLSL